MIGLIVTLGLSNCGQGQWEKSTAAGRKKTNKPGSVWGLFHGSKKKENPDSPEKGQLKTDTFPEYKGSINDYARILDSEYGEMIKTMLDTLDQEMGIQAAVFTISAVDKYSGKNIRDFAGELLKDCGIGDKKKNGVLILYSLEARECVIALGEKYGNADRLKMGRIIEKTMDPYFGKNEYGEGMFAGVTDLIVHLTNPDLDDIQIGKPNENAGSDVASELESADAFKYGIEGTGDPLKAFELYKKAASHGDVNAMVELSEYYEQGIWVKRDHEKAVELLKKAADAGSISAKWQLEFLKTEK